jgi:hypothetical protein
MMEFVRVIREGDGTLCCRFQQDVEHDALVRNESPFNTLSLFKNPQILISKAVTERIQQEVVDTQALEDKLLAMTSSHYQKMDGDAPRSELQATTLQQLGTETNVIAICGNDNGFLNRTGRYNRVREQQKRIDQKSETSIAAQQIAMSQYTEFVSNPTLFVNEFALTPASNRSRLSTIKLFGKTMEHGKGLIAARTLLTTVCDPEERRLLYDGITFSRRLLYLAVDIESTVESWIKNSQNTSRDMLRILMAHESDKTFIVCKNVWEFFFPTFIAIEEFIEIVRQINRMFASASSSAMRLGIRHRVEYLNQLFEYVATKPFSDQVARFLEYESTISRKRTRTDTPVVQQVSSYHVHMVRFIVEISCLLPGHNKIGINYVQISDRLVVSTRQEPSVVNIDSFCGHLKEIECGFCPELLKLAKDLQARCTEERAGSRIVRRASVDYYDEGLSVAALVESLPPICGDLLVLQYDVTGTKPVVSYPKGLATRKLLVRGFSDLLPRNIYLHEDSTMIEWARLVLLLCLVPDTYSPEEQLMIGKLAVANVIGPDNERFDRRLLTASDVYTGEQLMLIRSAWMAICQPEDVDAEIVSDEKLTALVQTVVQHKVVWGNVEEDTIPWTASMTAVRVATWPHYTLKKFMDRLFYGRDGDGLVVLRQDFLVREVVHIVRDDSTYECVAIARK